MFGNKMISLPIPKRLARHTSRDNDVPSLVTKIGKTQTLERALKKLGLDTPMEEILTIEEALKNKNGGSIVKSKVSDDYKVIQKGKYFEIILEKSMPQEAIHCYGSDVCYYVI